MTDNASIARANAMHCEAKKHGYRQTQDGVVVSFVLHPQEVPDLLATASLGTRYMLALVEVADDESPKEVVPNPAPQLSGQHNEPPRSVRGVRHPSGAKSWHTMRPSQQAGVLCNDPVFWKFLNEGVRLEANGAVKKTWSRRVENVQDAANAVRHLCAVNSRADIGLKNDSGEHWREIVSLYRAWGRVLEVAG